ncbi:hypothetical protein D3C87_1658220 [compost metagenome]
MRVTVAEILIIGKLQRLQQFQHPGFGFPPVHDAVVKRPLDNLFANLHGRVERRSCTLRHIGDARTARRLTTGAIHRHQRNAIHDDFSTNDSATVSAISHGGKPDGGFTGAGFTDQPFDLTALEIQIDTINQNCSIRCSNFQAANLQDLIVTHRSAP